MVQINFAQKQVNAKIVYYGPGMSGKTTNLEVIHQRAPDQNRGDLTSISTDGDRTLFFDFMPLDLGTVAGMRTCFQIYTVPGQVYYNSTRKLVLQGVDGVVFVADSSASMVEENLESLRNLEENLNEYGKSLTTLPHVIQFNKRDLPDALPPEEMNRILNPSGKAGIFEAVASTGQGVFPTLKGLAAAVLETIHSGGSSVPAARSAAPVQPGAALPQTQAPAPAHASPQPALAAGRMANTGFQQQGQAQPGMPLTAGAGGQNQAWNGAPPQGMAPVAPPPQQQGHAQPAQAPQQQTYAPQPAQTFGTPPQGYAQPNQQAGSGLQMAGSQQQRSYEPPARRESSNEQPARARRQAPTQRGSRKQPKTLEGTRFRPRSSQNSGGARRSTPTEGGNKKGMVVGIVAAVALVIGVVLAQVVFSLF